MTSTFPTPIRRRGFLAGMAGVAAAPLVLTGCGGDDPGTASGNATLTSWVFGQKGAPALRDVVEGFADSTGTKVEEGTFPYLQYLNQVVLKARGGNMKGVAHIDEEWLSALASAGALKDLSKHVDTGLYPDTVVAGGQYKGVRYAMPWTQSAIGMIGNSELLGELGVDVAKVSSPDDFKAALQAIHKADASLVPYAPCTSVEQLKDMIPWMQSFGSKVVDGENVVLGDEGSIAAIEFWKGLLDEGLIQGGVVRDDARTLFAQKKAVIYDDAPQAYGVVPPQSDDADLGDKMLPLRRPATATPANLVWSQPLVAFDEDESTIALLKYMSTDMAALKSMFEASGQPPATKEAIEADWFAGNAFNKSWIDTVAGDAVANPLWAFPSATAAQTLFNEAVETALKGTVSAADAMKTAKEGLTELLTG